MCAKVAAVRCASMVETGRAMPPLNLSTSWLTSRLTSTTSLLSAEESSCGSAGLMTLTMGSSLSISTMRCISMRAEVRSSGKRPKPCSALRLSPSALEKSSRSGRWASKCSVPAAARLEKPLEMTATTAMCCAAAAAPAASICSTQATSPPPRPAAWAHSRGRPERLCSCCRGSWSMDESSSLTRAGGTRPAPSSTPHASYRCICSASLSCRLLALTWSSEALPDALSSTQLPPAAVAAVGSAASGVEVSVCAGCCCSSRSASRREMMASSVCASEARRVSLTRRSSR
mmetsp:Transcript_79351/g.192050  ORF Transcript_79351/g.192050 Transcript_79351/m.192050 type:complete len:288 (-) Transcript_79351:532-1395(-)